MDNLEEKVQLVLDKFTHPFRQDSNVLGILLTGSYAHSTPDTHSDLDIYIITDEQHWRERGNTFIDGYEIEYFINPTKQINAYLDEDETDLRPVTAHMFSHSKILYRKDMESNPIDQIIKRAKKILDKPLPDLDTPSIELARYGFDDGTKDLLDAKSSNDILAFHLTSHLIIQQAIRIFYRVKNIRQEKLKRMGVQLKTLDQQFYNRLMAVFNHMYDYEVLNDLITYVENLIGGKRPKEWKLRSECTV
ncbi:MAG: nucleotidyltransferase domain-containing protein [Candidatus Kariarchaeaceae archaeon]|jgi:predicted nucleotidyltransferase